MRFANDDPKDPVEELRALITQVEEGEWDETSESTEIVMSVHEARLILDRRAAAHDPMYRHVSADFEAFRHEIFQRLRTVSEVMDTEKRPEVGDMMATIGYLAREYMMSRNRSQPDSVNGPNPAEELKKIETEIAPYREHLSAINSAIAHCSTHVVVAELRNNWMR